MKPLGALGRLALQQRLKAGKPTYKDYSDFVRKLALAIEDETARAAFVTDALALVPGAAEAAAAALTQRAAQSNPASLAKAAPPPLHGPPPPPATAQGPSAPPAPAPVKKKRVIIYRGKRMEVDE